jgi:predicted ATPase/DNA-binding XRE family transcriptional regulator
VENIFTEPSFGQWLKRRRKAAGWTQEQLALQISCSTSALKKLEAEARRPSAQMVEQLSIIFNIPQNEKVAFLRFARGDWHYAPTEIMKNAPWRVSSEPPRSNLPALTTSLVGREKEIVDVREYLLRADIRLVTLIGPPGIGKTRLSLEAAYPSLLDFPDGVFFVPLAQINDSNLMALTITQRLGFAEIEFKSPLERLKAGIEGKQLLLVLDNLEQIIEGAAPLISDLLSTCPRLKILTTSREALRIPGEWLYSVPALDMPNENLIVGIETISEFPALVLFAERARAVRSDFVLHADNFPTIAAICAQLDGLPLAIELIAARIRLMSPQALLAKLSDQFILSADGMRAVSTRQKTLHNAISWSYNLLSVEEQTLFAKLSVFSGGFTLDAAGAIFSGTVTNASVSDLIALLLDKSLLQRTLDARSEPRFNMLVTIQQFALDHLRQKDEETEARNWHLAYFLDLAERADKEIHGPNQVKWMERFETDHHNFRAALEWCVVNQQTEAALRLFGALGWTWFVQSHYLDIYTWFNKIRSLPEIMNYPELYARILNQIGIQGWLLGGYQNARSALEESQEICLKLGSIGEKSLAETLNYLGMVLLWDGHDLDSAQSLFQQSFALYQKHADQRGMAFTILNRGKAEADRHVNHAAFPLFEQSLDMFRQLGDLWAIGRCSLHLGQLFLSDGNYDRALFFANQYLMICEESHFSQGITTAMNLLGDIFRLKGNFDQAEVILEDSQAIAHKFDLKESQAFAVGGLGLVALGRGDYPLAAKYAKDAYNIRRILHEKWAALDLVVGLAASAAGMNQFERAAKLQGAVQVLASAAKSQSYGFDPVEVHLLQIAHEQLGDEKFETLAAEGRVMTMKEAIAYALELSTD